MGAEEISGAPAADSNLGSFRIMWSLSPGMRHLNHGSFGAVPLEVMKKQEEWRRRWEANTTAFILTDFQPGIDQARTTLAEFVGADPAGMVFVRNASQGVASVVRSIEPWLNPGDELLTTNQDYNAIRQTLEFTAARHGARVVVAPIPFPIDSPSQATTAILDSASDRTRLAVIDHITSPTGLVLPIDEIVSALEPELPVLPRSGAGAGGRRRTRRLVVHRQSAQVDLCTQGCGVSSHTSRSNRGDSPHGHLARLECADGRGWQSLPGPFRLGGDR